MVVSRKNQIYNPKTRRWIADNAANRKRVAAVKKARSRSRSKSLTKKVKEKLAAAGAAIVTGAKKIRDAFKPSKPVKINAKLCSQFKMYEKRTKKRVSRVMGIESRPGYYYPFKNYNEFSSTEKKVPSGFRKRRNINVKDYCDASKRPITAKSPEYLAVKNAHRGEKSYYTHWNGGRPYIVYVGSKRVTVYKEDDNRFYVKDYRKYAPLYIKMVKQYRNPRKVFVGQSGDYGPKFDGNSVLIYLGGTAKTYRYAFIGATLYEFSTSEPITEYYSNVGNSDVPYPVAVSKSYAYFMDDHKYVKKSEFSEDTEWDDSYAEFFELPKSTKKVNFRAYKLINKAY